VETEDGEISYRGTVLDPEECLNYRCMVTVQPGGTRLLLRGFIGPGDLRPG